MKRSRNRMERPLRGTRQAHAHSESSEKRGKDTVARQLQFDFISVENFEKLSLREKMDRWRSLFGNEVKSSRLSRDKSELDNKDALDENIDESEGDKEEEQEGEGEGQGQKHEPEQEKITVEEDTDAEVIKPQGKHGHHWEKEMAAESQIPRDINIEKKTTAATVSCGDESTAARSEARDDGMEPLHSDDVQHDLSQQDQSPSSTFVIDEWNEDNYADSIYLNSEQITTREELSGTVDWLRDRAEFVKWYLQSLHHVQAFLPWVFAPSAETIHASVDEDQLESHGLADFPSEMYSSEGRWKSLLPFPTRNVKVGQDVLPSTDNPALSVAFVEESMMQAEYEITKANARKFKALGVCRHDKSNCHFMVAHRPAET